MTDSKPHLFALFRDGRFAGASLNMEDAKALAEHPEEASEIVRYVPIASLDYVLKQCHTLEDEAHDRTAEIHRLRSIITHHSDEWELE